MGFSPNKKPALSNSRLSVQKCTDVFKTCGRINCFLFLKVRSWFGLRGFIDKNVEAFYERIFDCSIDRLTIVGDFVRGRLFDDFAWLQNKFDTDTDFKFLASNLHQTSFQMFDDKVYIQLQYGKFVKGRAFRMDYNPNNLTKEQATKIKDVILPAVKNAKFTRVDIAFDIDYPLSKFMYLEKIPKKKSNYVGKTGAVETMYFGTRESNEQLRIYDKNTEGSGKVRKVDEETGEVSYEFEPPKDKQGNLHEHWWRLEFTLKQDKIEIFRNPEECIFGNYRIVKLSHLDYEKIEKVTDRALVYYIMNNPDEKGSLNKRQRKKFEEYIVDMADVEVTDAFKAKYKEKRADIQFHLSQWMSNTTKVINK